MHASRPIRPSSTACPDDHLGPDLQAATQAHRGGDPDRAGLDKLIVRPTDRPYGLIPGLRRRRDWPSIGGPSLRATLVNLRRHHLVSVVDVDPLIDLTPPGQALGPSTPRRTLSDGHVAGRPGGSGRRHR